MAAVSVSGAHRHQSVLDPLLHHPDVERIGRREADDHAQRHHAPEDQFERVHRPHVTSHHQQTHGGSHAGHHGVHADEFGREALPHVLPVGAAHHLLHEQRLEDEEAEREAGHVLDDEVDPHRQSERGGDHRRQDDARRVACDAVDGAADALLPQRRREALMLARTRFLVGEHVEQETEGTHVQRDEDEAPLHHRRLGIAGELVVGDVGRGRGGHDEPGDQVVVVGQRDHADLPLIRSRASRHIGLAVANTL